MTQASTLALPASSPGLPVILQLLLSVCFFFRCSPAMTLCQTCGVVASCFKLDPLNPSTDDCFHCATCWQQYGGIPKERVIESTPQSCSSCRASNVTLWMLDPYNESSTLTWHCDTCWSEYKGVPGKAVCHPWPQCIPLQMHQGQDLQNTYVTDYGFPNSDMLSPLHCPFYSW